MPISIDITWLFNLDTLGALRLLLSVTLAFSAYATLKARRNVARALQPHFTLIAVWSVSNCLLMFLLVTDHTHTMGLLQVLNVSSIVLLGSWAALMLRLAHSLTTAIGVTSG